MLNALKDFFRPAPAVPAPRVPAGTRYYVIGDIHGRLDLFETMVDAIEADLARADIDEARIILLGDLVDRGPDSAGVLALTRDWQARRNVRVLAGNHEEMFLQAFEKPEILRHFLKHGGRETILSYGLSRKRFNTLELEELFEFLPELVSRKERDYIASFEEMIVAGDYVFVHAGVDPARPLDEQKRSDLLWIRDRFLDHEGPLEKVVVHGHTIFDRVMDCGNRIGIDTGAFRSGVLTALVLEGDQRRVIQTCREDSGPVEIFHGDRAR
ncbi:MAG: metallophosphoesterase family protein [Erythrobacter sp.]|uniref:metallophosphoesterase family protein n=1 Tax=Erythrobacter sp. HL-111 TaxID=1798193 RepID=UPI0006DB3A2A|nr:metallophosphoesterase family protein [Erythrobacter sp. HL-111]KPP84939.1 MAG: serine/threonine protein phosphatase PphA [Erythrobacteraceae bacterium HL-111]SDT08087.1 serine/threonine protein phosphatase 1 [Erythrobacter sp. HL-111]